MERENLQVFTRGRHPSIIQALCFYQWRGQINFVFPFIDGTLEKLLGGQWCGPEKDYLETMDPPHHWLWAQMIGVAEGLSTIHNLQNTESKRNGKRMIGFHFDLKPANILINLKGELKISDFGLSLIKRTELSSMSRGFFRGGTPKYQAPEVSRMRGIAPHLSTGLSTDEDNSESVNNKYDVWSYACIALEVLIYISGENGAEMLMRFEKAINEEQFSCAFWYNGKLKNCVEDTLRRIGGNTAAGEEVVGQSAWAKVTVAYLRHNMFEFNPSLRPSSIKVADRLQRICDEHADTPKDELELELKKYSSEEYPKDRFHEIYWHTVDGDVSFLRMFVLR